MKSSQGELQQAQGPTVLVVEDDPTLSSTLLYNLRRSGFTPLAAADGERGYQVFRDHQSEIELVILDLMLPRMPGLHVLRNIRSNSMTPVLVLSARGQEQDKVDALNLGADDYIVKPFAVRELVARIHALLRRSAHPAGMATTIERGSVRIDTTGRRAWVGDVELSLRPKEFGLLLTLTLGAGKVFSRQELLDSIWGREIIVDERTVDVHVSWLRGKLRRAGLADDPIQTAYGIGYRFVTSSAQLSSPSESLRQGGGDVQSGQAAGLSIG